MNKQIYNQISVKLYQAYKEATIADEKDKHGDASNQLEFIQALELDTRIVSLFDSIYKSDMTCPEGIYVDEIFSAIRSLFPLPKRLKFFEGKTLAERGRLFAIQAHRDVDHLYGDKLFKAPYELHLYIAVKYFKKYKHHVALEDQDYVEAAAWNHDVVEDGHKTFNDVKAATDERVARLATALSTNVHGHNRKERADAAYYQRIRAEKYGPFLKLCDRLANVSYGVANGGTMVEKYRQEMPEFLKALGQDVVMIYADMVNELNELVGLKEVA